MVTFLKRIFLGLFWIAVVAFAAALPWLVQERLQPSAPAPPAETEASADSPTPPLPEDGPGTTPESTEEAEEEAIPVAAVPDRSLGEKVSDFFQQSWMRVRNPKDEGAGAGITSERSEAVAARIGPALVEKLEAKDLSLGLPLFLRIFKESNELELWMEPEPGAEFVLFQTYPICAWSGDLGPKLKEGDRQAPEGFYFVPPAQMNPESRYHLSFDLGFPNQFDQHHERTGSYLMVHGDCVSIGCYAMTDAAIEEIYTLAVAALGNGQSFFRVHAFPFRMSDDRMDDIDESAKWFDFWANLKEGYDYFDLLGRPPDVTVVDGKYQFE